MKIYTITTKQLCNSVACITGGDYRGSVWCPECMSTWNWSVVYISNDTFM